MNLLLTTLWATVPLLWRWV